MKKESIVFVLFGATGDLARKRIIPALFELHGKNLLPKEWSAVMFLRRDWDREEFESFLSGAVREAKSGGSRALMRSFLSRISAFRGELEDKASFAKLKKFLDEKDKNGAKVAARIFYLAISPMFYKTAIKHIKNEKLLSSSDKLLIEKPFGKSGKEAKTLEKLLSGFIGERRIFRVDHYLAKDAMKEALGSALPPARFIQKVEARIMEDGHIGRRGPSYDAVGALLDVGQNHLLQMLAAALLGISKGARGDASRRRYEMLKTFAIKKEGLARAQYKGYKGENGVSSESRTETYFRAILQSGRSDLKKIKLVMEAGKGFKKATSEVKIFAKGKRAIKFDFRKGRNSLLPHAKLILSAIGGDRALFVSKEEVAEQWRIAEEILRAWRGIALRMYVRGAKKITK